MPPSSSKNFVLLANWSGSRAIISLAAGSQPHSLWAVCSSKGYVRTDAITSGDGKLLDAGPNIEQLHLDGPTGYCGTGESAARYNYV